MNVQDVIKVALSLIGKREEIGGIVKDAIALFKKIQATLPEVTKQLESATSGGVPTPGVAYSIEWLQKSLNDIIDAKLPVDGKYGQATQDAVKKFQTQHGLDADGWAGALTQAAILEALK